MYRNHLISPFFVIVALLIFDSLPVLPVSQRFNGDLQSIEAGKPGRNILRVPASRASRDRIAELFGALPLTFEPNQGQAAPNVKYLSRAGGCSFLLSATAAWLKICNPADSSTEVHGSHRQNESVPALTVSVNLIGASDSHHVTTSGELPGKANYFIGTDPGKWRTNIPTFSRIKFHSVYRGVDLSYYGNGRELEYDFIVAPGASFKTIRLGFAGAKRLTLDDSGDLLIETHSGPVRQLKPVIYQETAGVKRPVYGNYVIHDTLEAGFAVPSYDPSLPLVIDPVFVYSTSIGGSRDEFGNGVAMDSEGNAYITGATSSLDFPSVNAIQPGIKTGEFGAPSDAFVAKLNPTGTELLYSTYLGGIGFDTGNGIAVDSSGNAYITGASSSNDFPTTANAFQTTASGGGDAFIAKLNAAGNRLSYSTYLGGPNARVFGANTNVGRGIAVDREGSAYIAGYTYSHMFPLKKAAQITFNSGNINGFDCLRFLLAPVAEDAFITKLNPAGSGLSYSTYLGGIGTDEAYGIAVDSNGNAYVTGTTCSIDFPTTVPSSEVGVGAFLTKLSSSGRDFVYSRRLGGRGQDFGNSVAVDANGNAYVTGQTDSDNFPTVSPLQPHLGGSVLYITNDGGLSWKPVPGLSNSPVNSVAIDPSNPLRVLVASINRFGAGSGLLESDDGGATWEGPGFVSYPSNYAQGIGIDPKNPAVVYTDLYKTTNSGATWTLMRFPSGGPFGPAHLLIDPVNNSTLYLLSLGGIGGDVVFPPRFFKTTDAGGSWELVRNGTNLFTPTSAVLDPQNPSTLFATLGDLYKSTDGGTTWRVPYQGTRNFSRLAIDPINPSTLYLSDPSGSLYKTTDSGVSFNKLADLGIKVNELQIDPKTPTTVYAATGESGRGGAVFKTIDGGQSWSVTDLVAASVNSLAIDPVSPLTLIAGVDFDVDSFVAKSNATGSALIYSTYLGTRSIDVATGIGIDGVGNAYVTGRTLSDRFIAREPLQATKPSGLFDSAAFLTMFEPAGSAIPFSTYVGGSEPSAASGLGVDPSGRLIIVGTTGSGLVFHSGVSTESVHGGLDAFVIKISSPPRITGVSVSGKNLIVNGVGFDSGAVVLIDGVEQRTKHDQERPATMLVGKKSAKNINPGQQVIVQVKNSDGLMSQSFSFVR
jgi:photosystem II stability/assembly factor-like uncharacterized protein